MLKYQDRLPKLKERPTPFVAGDKKTDDWFSYLINEWIPNQPDADELMSLFIDCGFKSNVFICEINPTESNKAILQTIEIK